MCLTPTSHHAGKSRQQTPHNILHSHIPQQRERALHKHTHTHTGKHTHTHAHTHAHTQDLPNGLGNVTEGVHSGTSNGLLVCLEQLQQLKTDSHPLTSTDVLRTTVCNATNQINAILLDLLMPGQYTKQKKRHPNTLQ